jgi:hypothetical protein
MLKSNCIVTAHLHQIGTAMMKMMTMSHASQPATRNHPTSDRGD